MPYEPSFIQYVIQVLEGRGDGIVFVHDGLELTARQVLKRIRDFQQSLAACGLKSGKHFAILAGNLPDAYITKLAGLGLGAIYTGLHPLGSLDDHVEVLKDSRCQFLIYDTRSYGNRARELMDQIPDLKIRFIGSEAGTTVGSKLESVETENIESESEIAIKPSASDVAQIAYTGGTTGKSKGVIHTHGSMLAQEMGVMTQLEWPAYPKLLICTPITHASGQMIMPIIALRGTVYLHDQFRPDAFWNTLIKDEINVTFGVPTMIYALLGSAGSVKKEDIALETFIYGASPMSPSRLAEAIDMFGPIFVQGYGQTEIGSAVINLHKEDHILGGERLASAGRIAPGIDIQIMDEHDHPVAPGEIGEICLRGKQMMSGYWQRPDATARALRGGWLHTDDLGFMDKEGFITLVDRKKDMIITGGFNVYPTEVENAITSMPGVLGAAVIGVPSEKWGEEVRAFVIKDADSQITAEDIKAYVKKHKGSVQSPKEVVFVNDLPVTAVGKLDKKRLKSAFWKKEDRAIH